jgi:site-specific DNA-methyltransferase (adenine-specific)
MGSGTTAKMALVNGRNFIGSEISADYIEIANKRIDN